MYPHDRWLDRANYDLETAEAMCTSARYIYAVFMCQQALGKCLKAMLVYQGKEVLPVHNLRRLFDATGSIGELNQEALLKVDCSAPSKVNRAYAAWGS